MGVNTSIQIAFGGTTADGTSAADGHLSAEVDDRPAGLNAGDTSFAPGATAWFLIYASANVTYSPPVASAGDIIQGAQGILITKTEDLEFADDDTAALSLPALEITAVTWLGTALGGLTMQDPMTLKADAKGVAVARVTYTARADAWAIASPATLAGLTDFSILVYILGQVQPF